MKHFILGAALLAAACGQPAAPADAQPSGARATAAGAAATPSAPAALPPLGPYEQYGVAICDAGQMFAVVQNVPRDFDDPVMNAGELALREQWFAHLRQQGHGALVARAGCQTLMQDWATGAIAERIGRGMNRVEWIPQ